MTYRVDQRESLEREKSIGQNRSRVEGKRPARKWEQEHICSEENQDSPGP